MHKKLRHKSIYGIYNRALIVPCNSFVVQINNVNLILNIIVLRMAGSFLNLMPRDSKRWDKAEYMPGFICSFVCQAISPAPPLCLECKCITWACSRHQNFCRIQTSLICATRCSHNGILNLTPRAN